MLMKKFLLFSIVALASIFSAKAEYTLSLAELGSGWDSSYDPATKTITYEGAWTGRGWWLDNVDLSKYNQVVVELETTAIGAQIVVEYNDKNIKSSTGGANAGVTKLVCDLDPVGKSSVKQIYIQSKAVGSLTLVSAYCPDVLTYGTPVTLEPNEWWQIESKAFNGYSDNAKITFTWTSIGAANFMGWGAGSLKSVDETVDTKYGFDIKAEGTNTFSCLLSDIKEALNAGPSQYGMYGIMWNIWDHNKDGNTCTDTRVSITIAEVEGFEGEGYKAPSADALETIETDSENAPVYNLFGQESESKGLVIKNGKTVLVK